MHLAAGLTEPGAAFVSDSKRPSVRPQISPVYAGGGLAAALGKGPAANAAAGSGAVPAGADQDWILFGVDTVAQLAAENAARAAGQELGTWLADLIAESATGEK